MQRFVSAEVVLEATVAAAQSYADLVVDHDPDDGEHVVPGELRRFLARLRLLHGVPFSYLVPDADLLPIESIRFFYVDRAWTDAVVQGALSVGTITTADRAQLEAVYPKIRDDVDEAERTIRTPRGEERLQGAGGTITGFLMRSRAVSGWPNLHVRAYSRDVLADDALTTAAESDPSRMKVLRLERLAPAVLLVLFDGVPAVVHIEEPRQGIQFGVRLDPADPPAQRRAKVKVRDNLTGDPVPPKDSFTTGNSVDVPFRRGAPGVRWTRWRCAVPGQSPSSASRRGVADSGAGSFRISGVSAGSSTASSSIRIWPCNWLVRFARKLPSNWRSFSTRPRSRSRSRSSSVNSSSRRRSASALTESALLRASELTNQLLALSGHGQLVMSDVELEPLICEMVALLTPGRPGAARLELERVPSVRADAAQVRQIVLNLVTNAFDALGTAGGEVRVRTRLVEVGGEAHPSDVLTAAPGRYVSIEVGDNGGRIGGIVEHQSQRLWHRVLHRPAQRRHEGGVGRGRQMPDHAAGHDEAELVNGISRIRHKDHIAWRGDRLGDIGESFLGAERGDDLRVGVELHPEAARVISGLRPAQTVNAARGRIAVGAGIAHGLDQLGDDMWRRRHVRVAHAEINDVLAARARFRLEPVDLLEYVRR